jgi:hypothetical protein
MKASLFTPLALFKSKKKGWNGKQLERSYIERLVNFMISNRILTESRGEVFVDEEFRAKVVPILLSLATGSNIGIGGGSEVIRRSIRIGASIWLKERNIHPSDEQLTGVEDVILTLTDVNGLSEILTKYANR